MRVKNLLWSLIGAMALSACSSENESFDESNPEVNSESRFMAVEVMNPSRLTRAAGDDYGKDYEKGTEAENKINNLRFYFFDNSGNAVTVNNGVNFVNATSIEPVGDAPANVELKLKAVLVINTKQGDNANVNTMLAVANYNYAELGDESLSRDALMEKVNNYNAAVEDNFLMTSSSYVGADGPVSVATIKPENLCTSEDAAMNSPVEIYIERLVAKTKLSTEWNESMSTLKGITYDGKDGYTAVALKDKDDKDIKVDDKQVYVIFTGWNVTNTANQSYLLKKVNAWNLGRWAWNHAEAYRSYWAMNPIENFKLNHVSYEEANLSVGSNVYCFENAADNFDDGTKSPYNPEKEISNRTQALIAAVLVTIDGTKATPVSLAKWAGTDYTEEEVKEAMYGQVTSVIYYETTEGEPSETNPRKFASIKLTDVELVSGEDAGQADDKSENSKRYLSYLKLKGDASNIQFYTAAVNNITTEGKTQDEINKEIENAKYTDAKAVNKVLATVPGAKVWKDGKTYYYTDLKHLGSDATKGLYGVVRNHIYDVKINSVKGLGTPVYKVDEAIIPQKPTDDDTFIAAQVNVLSWRVVPNNVDLEW